MNGRRAKAIRRVIYGDQSLKNPRKYKFNMEQHFRGPQCVETGHRGLYQAMKKLWASRGVRGITWGRLVRDAAVFKQWRKLA